MVYWLYDVVFYPEYVGSRQLIFLRHVGINLQDCTMSQSDSHNMNNLQQKETRSYAVSCQRFTSIITDFRMTLLGSTFFPKMKTSESEMPLEYEHNRPKGWKENKEREVWQLAALCQNKSRISTLQLLRQPVHLTTRHTG